MFVFVVCIVVDKANSQCVLIVTLIEMTMCTICLSVLLSLQLENLQANFILALTICQAALLSSYVVHAVSIMRLVKSNCFTACLQFTFSCLKS